MRTVTISGVDQSNSFQDYSDLFKKYPFLEFGVLFSLDNDKNKYPPLDWIWGFLENVRGRKSLHACPSAIFHKHGPGYIRVAVEAHGTRPLVDRMQINVNMHEVEKESKLLLLYNILSNRYDDSILSYFKGDVILQCNYFNSYHLKIFEHIKKLDILIDESLGTGSYGISKPIMNHYILNVIPEGCRIGVAGGLSPANALETTTILEDYDVKWLDAETKLRDNNDNFSIDKADAFLSALEDWAYM